MPRKCITWSLRCNRHLTWVSPHLLGFVRVSIQLGDTKGSPGLDYEIPWSVDHPPLTPCSTTHRQDSHSGRLRAGHLARQLLRAEEVCRMNAGEPGPSSQEAMLTGCISVTACAIVSAESARAKQGVRWGHVSCQGGLG